MPPINRHGCNKCDFELPTGWGGYTYAIDNAGKRVRCPHPGEARAVCRVTGLDYAKAREAGLTGSASHCVCLDCVEKFDLDLARDVVICPACNSTMVRSLRQLIGQQCPLCKAGRIEESSFVRWELDPDWEQLPVPQIMKDLLEFEKLRCAPGSLQRASEIANGFDQHNFFTLATRILDWWEGSYFLGDQKQKDSAEMQPQWTWCKALPAVLETTPELAELVVIREGQCWFRDEIRPEMRRGMKNYLRKHRFHVVWS